MWKCYITAKYSLTTFGHIFLKKKELHETQNKTLEALGQDTSVWKSFHVKMRKDKYLKCCRRFNFSPISSGKFPLKAFRKMNLENPNLEEYVVRGKREKF